MKTINIKGKEYVTVDERIKFLRENYPDSQILTEIINIDAESIIMKASLNINGKVVAVGHASEDKNSSYINKTSYIENCETSAIGRCLGIYGIGVCGSIASADEVTPSPPVPQVSTRARFGFASGSAHALRNTWAIAASSVP